MKLDLSEAQLLNVLQSVRSEYNTSKVYYTKYSNEEDRIGIVSPDEWKRLYNNILVQLHKEEKFSLLELIK